MCDRAKRKIIHFPYPALTGPHEQDILHLPNPQPHCPNSNAGQHFVLGRPHEGQPENKVLPSASSASTLAQPSRRNSTTRSPADMASSPFPIALPAPMRRGGQSTTSWGVLRSHADASSNREALGGEAKPGTPGNNCIGRGPWPAIMS